MNNTFTNIFISSMLVTSFVGFDVAHTPKVEVQAQDEQVVVSTPTPTAELTTEPQVTRYIRPTTCQGAIMEVFGELAPQAERVSFCESSFNPKSQHTNSSAKGCFQIIKGTWKQFKCEGDVLDPLDNAKCAKKIYDNQKAWNTRGGWAASYHCHNQI